MSEQGDFGLNISSGLIRHHDGTFGVYVLLSFAGRDDVEPVRKVLTDESDAPVSFAAEREAQIAAFDWMQDIRQDALSRPPPGSTWASEGEIERIDYLSEMETETRETSTSRRIRLSDLAHWLRGYDYEVRGPEGDDREAIVTLDGVGGVHLTAPPD